MTPIFRIVADGADITTLINDRLLLLRTTDKPGMESDDLSCASMTETAPCRCPVAGPVWRCFSVTAAPR